MSIIVIDDETPEEPTIMGGMVIRDGYRCDARVYPSNTLRGLRAAREDLDILIGRMQAKADDGV